MGNMQENHPPRGTIIVDTSGLMPCLNTHISGDHFYRPPRRENAVYYVEMLRVLAEHGFRIVIPEMVTLETADMLWDGRSFNSYFAKNKNKHVSSVMNVDSLAAFFRRAIEHHLPGVTIRGSQDAPHDPGRDVRSYIEKLYAALTIKDPEERRKAVLATYNTPKEGFGDDVIADLMRREYAEDVANHKAFVLTADNGLIKRLGGLDKVITPRQLIYSFIDGGLGGQLGLKRERQKEEFERDMLKEQNYSPLHHAERYREHPFFALVQEIGFAGHSGGQAAVQEFPLEKYKGPRSKGGWHDR